MRSLTHLFACAVTVAGCLVWAPRGHAAAQLASGARTSAQPTSTNPQIRQCQITFDPDIILNSNAATTPSYSLTGFQLSVQYDTGLVTVNDLLFVSPFVETPAGAIGGALPSAASTGTVGKNYVNDPRTGTISDIGASADPKNVPAGQDVNIFAVDFTLGANTTFDTPLTFTILANPQANDFITGTDPTTGQTITTPASGVEPTTITMSFNQMTAFVNGTPEPSGVVAGLATLVAAGASRRRRRQPVA